MWCYTRYGFYSVVQKPGDQDLTIRSRVRADLERLKLHYLPKLSEIVETNDSDYKFRAKATHAAFADALYHIAQDIDYPNFKDTVAQQQGSDRAKVYTSVWASTMRLTDLHDKLSNKEMGKVHQSFRLSTEQRRMMQALYQSNKEKEWRAAPFYAVAEKLGLVERESNQYNISSEEYAEALFQDGNHKGWIRKPLTETDWQEVLRVFVYRFLVDNATINGRDWFEDK
jgi:hypothetical protein